MRGIRISREISYRTRKAGSQTTCLSCLVVYFFDICAFQEIIDAYIVKVRKCDQYVCGNIPCAILIMGVRTLGYV